MSRRDAAPPPQSDALDGVTHPRNTHVLFGQSVAEAALLEAYRSGRLPHAWILGGRPGIGKATLAWRMARFLLAHPDPASTEVQNATDLAVPATHPAARLITSSSSPDLVALRREWNDKTDRHFTEIRVEDVRKALHMFRHASGSGGWRIAIIDSADDLNRSGANALLKLIEEPPQRSLFLIISHQPGRLLPTIRSRCRKLFLEPLGPADIAAAIRAQGGALAATKDDVMERAIRDAEGSVQETLRMLGAAGSGFTARVEAMLNRLPLVDWNAVQNLAEELTGRKGDESYAVFVETVLRWLTRSVRAGAEAGALRLAPLAEVWETFGRAVRDAETYNLDRRPLILSTFEQLGAAVPKGRT